jgi:hypothetical protein
MDDHVKQMGNLTALIAEVKSQASIHTQHVLAQLDGLRMKVDVDITITKLDIVDIRGRIVPDLRDHANTIASNVKCLEDRFGSFDANNLTLAITCIEECLDAFWHEFDEYTKNPISVNVSPPRSPPHTHDTATVDDPTGPDPKPHNPRFPNIDPTTFRPATSWYAPCTTLHQDSHGDSGLRPYPIDMANSDDDMALLMGGRITSPRASNKERQARKLLISRHDIARRATPAYHGGRHGVPYLSLSFIHACRYQSFSPEIEDNVLPCYSTIQLLHRKVNGMDKPSSFR